MFGIFSKKPLLSDDDFLFQIETYKWLMKHFGGEAFFKETALVQPTSEFFPNKVGSHSQAAETTFLQVKKYAGMENWACELIEQEADVDIKVAPIVLVQGAESSPLGTFSVQENNVSISYNPALTNNPMQLVATFAHELSHYLTATASEEPPGGWDNWEFVTDLTAVFLGFGVFMANSAFNFQQFTEFDSQGWSSNRSGYLSEIELGFALAIFCKLQNIEAAEACKHLKTNVKKIVKLSLSELNQKVEIIEGIRNVRYEPNKAS
jgi:hypothetical protein